MYLLLKRTNLIFIIFTFLFTSSLPVSADRLSTMVEGVLESHEDIVNSKKELEEAEVAIIDEMSMISVDHFYHLHKRLMEIFDSKDLAKKLTNDLNNTNTSKKENIELINNLGRNILNETTRELNKIINKWGG